jgi:hypothetical protein
LDAGQRQRGAAEEDQKGTGRAHALPNVEPA